MGRKREIEMSTIDYSALSAIESMVGEDAEETSQLRALYERAVNYICSFHWHGKIEKIYFGLGVSDIVGVFLFELTPRSANVDKLLWVIIGDVPPAYLVTDDAPDAATALQVYIREMNRWVEAAKAGASIKEVIPVNAPPTIGNATDLERRLKFLEEEILPQYRSKNG